MHSFPSGDSPDEQVAAALCQVAAALTGEEDVAADDALAPLLTAVLATVPGAEWGSLAYRRPTDGRPLTMVASGKEATAADEAQYHLGEGPCVEALTGTPVRVSGPELAERYPRFAALAAEVTPIRAALSYPVPAEAGLAGCVNFYGAEGFAEPAEPPAARAAAAVGVAYAGLLQRRRADNLDIALSSSRQIAAAVGILMARHAHTYDAAFEQMRSYSQRAHIKMRDLAEEVLLIGMLPELPHAARPAHEGGADRNHG